MSDILHCNWEDCAFTTTSQKTAIWHVLCNHAPEDQVPFYCSLCGFKTQKKKLLYKHVSTYKPHVEMKTEYPNIMDELFFHITENPYFVTFDTENADFSTCFTESVLEDQPEITDSVQSELNTVSGDQPEVNSASDQQVAIVEEIVEIVNIPQLVGEGEDTNIDDINSTENEKDSQIQELKRELNVMKGAHAAEMKRMGSFVERIEARLDRRNKEIEKLREEFKRQEPFVQGFDEMWEREKARPKRPVFIDENSPPKKKIKSVVRKLF